MLEIFFDKKEKKKPNLHEYNPNLNKTFRKADHIRELLILLVQYLFLEYSRETEG